MLQELIFICATLQLLTVIITVRWFATWSFSVTELRSSSAFLAHINLSSSVGVTETVHRGLIMATSSVILLVCLLGTLNTVQCQHEEVRGLNCPGASWEQGWSQWSYLALTERIPESDGVQSCFSSFSLGCWKEADGILWLHSKPYFRSSRFSLVTDIKQLMELHDPIWEIYSWNVFSCN